MYELRFLGGAAIEDREGGPAAISARRHPVALLALLAVAPSRSMSRTNLIGLLWPDSPEGRGRERLNTSVYQIRCVTGNGVLRSLGDVLRLEEAEIGCDVWSFDRAVSAGEPERAVTLYRGPFLEGFYLDGAHELDRRIDAFRARLERDLLGALETLGDEAERDGRFEAAARWWARRARIEPFDSTIAYRLCDTLLRAGKAAEALVAAREHIRRMEVELGLAARPEIDRLIGRIEADRAAPPAPGGSVDADTVVPAREQETRPTSTRPAAPAATRPARLAFPRWRRRVVYATVSAAGMAVAWLTGYVTSEARHEVGRQSAGSPETARESAASPLEAANELYRQARLLDESPAQEGTGRGQLSLLRRAIEIHPEFAPAWAALADGYVQLAWTSGSTAWVDSAERAATRALRIDPGLPGAHAQLGDIRWTQGREDEAVQAYERALELDPGHGEAINNLLVLLEREGRFARLANRLDRFLEYHPGTATTTSALVYLHAKLGDTRTARSRLDQGLGAERLVWTDYDLALFYEGDIERARGLIARLPEDGGDSDVSYRITRRLAAIALYEEDWDEARRLYRHLYPGVPRASSAPFKGLLWDPLGLACALDRLGAHDEARQIAREIVRRAEDNLPTGPDASPRLWLAVAHLILDDRSGALEWLDRAVDAGYRDSRFLQTVPTLARLRDAPEFRKLIVRVEELLAAERRAIASGRPTDAEIRGA